jgi:hypothetical protein
MDHLPPHQGTIVDPDDGCFSESNIKSHPTFFFSYLVFLFQSIEKITLRAPFSLVPQFTMKRRSITLGKEQVAELMVRLDKIPGLVESLIDTSIIPSREDVHMATTDRRDQKLWMQTVFLEKKRRRITELEDALGTSRGIVL